MTETPHVHWASRAVRMNHFQTMFPGGSTNAWLKNAEVFPH